MNSLPTRILLAAALLIALCLGAVPKVIGLSIEQATVERLLELIPPETQGQLEIRRNAFTEGWFSSSAEIEVLYTAIDTDAVALSLALAIDHGPLLQTADGLRLGLAYTTITPSLRNDLFDMAIRDLSIELPDVDIALLARFDQSLQIVLAISAIEYRDSDGQINFDGLEAQVDIDADQSALFTLQMGELSAMETANSNILVAGMSVRSKTAQVNDILADSSATLSVPSISSTAPLPFTLADISIDYGLQSSASGGQSSDIYQTLRVARFEGALPLNSFYWLSEVNQLNDELLRDYYQLINELQSDVNADPDAVGDELSSLGQQMALLTLQNPLELNNLIEMGAYEGDHSADLQISWAGLGTLSDMADLDMKEAIAALDMTLLVSLDLEAMLHSPFAGLIDPYVQQGYLTVSNGRVIIDGSLRDGILQLNGDELPLDQFF